LPDFSDSPAFSAEIRPQRSASERGINVFILVLAPIFLAPGIGFALVDAWPVAGFLGLDLAVLYGALRFSLRAGRARERITIGGGRVRVTRTDPRGRAETWDAPLDAARIAPTGQPGVSGGVAIHVHGSAIAVGRWLDAEDRRHLSDELLAAARGARASPLHGRIERTARYPRLKTSRMV
jgi:uncharacterized membrane protein